MKNTCQTNYVMRFLIFYGMLIFYVGSGFLLFRMADAFVLERIECMVRSDFQTIEEVMQLFVYTIDQIKELTKQCKQMASQELEKIFALSAQERTFANTVAALDNIKREYSIRYSIFHFLEMVYPERTIREAAHDAALELSQFSVDAFMNKKIYRAFEEYCKGNRIAEVITREEAYFLDESIKDFKRGGFGLTDDEFAATKELEKEIIQACFEFSTAIAQDASTIEVDFDDLHGLESDFVTQLKKTEQGKFILGCDYPTVHEVLEHCTVADTRKRLYQMFHNRAYPANAERLHSIIALRDRLAKKLGFASYAHLNIDSAMAKTPERVEQFLKDLGEKSLVKAVQEFDCLLVDLAPGVDLSKDGKLQPWDIRYAKEYYKKRHFTVDEREIAQYFPVQKTLEGIFVIYQQFLGITFEQIPLTNAWHDDVICIAIKNKSDHALRGYLFLDLYPRPFKYTHACLAPIVSSLKSDVSQESSEKFYRPGIAAIVANFPKPTSKKPALLKHDDVLTFFHEFGHAMHHMLGATQLDSLSGLSVRTDFVEVPSQMFEEWMWDPEILKQVSSHYKTGEPLPDDLIERKIALKRVASGHSTVRQVFLSFLALEYFKSGEKKDTSTLLRELHERYLVYLSFDPTDHFDASFGHLTGYGPLYYSYMWSKVFALDLFDAIKQHGLLDETIGEKFVDTILSKGGSQEPDELLYDFLGREPNMDAFLADLGL